MNLVHLLFAAIQIGFVSGFRAFTPVALISWLAVWGWVPLTGSSLWFLGTVPGAIITSVLALGELIGDKLPRTPSRIAPGPLGARLITGALCGAALCLAGGQTWIGGMIAGAVGAVVGAFAGFNVRRALVSKVGAPDLVIAIVEDLATIIGTLLIVSFLFGKSV
jgi:uncharacterized membrane protein